LRPAGPKNALNAGLTQSPVAELVLQISDGPVERRLSAIQTGGHRSQPEAGSPIKLRRFEATPLAGRRRPVHRAVAAIAAAIEIRNK